MLTPPSPEAPRPSLRSLWLVPNERMEHRVQVELGRPPHPRVSRSHSPATSSREAAGRRRGPDSWAAERLPRCEWPRVLRE